MSSTVFVRDRREAEIELRETLRVEKNIDLDDLPVRNGEGITDNTRPRGATTAPAAPFTSAGLTNG
jgi:hypothetical protein